MISFFQTNNVQTFQQKFQYTEGVILFIIMSTLNTKQILTNTPTTSVYMLLIRPPACDVSYACAVGARKPV